MKDDRLAVRIWDDVIPSTDVDRAVKESPWRERRNLRAMSSEVPTIVPRAINAGGRRAALVVAPGGGYARRAPHEAAPVAEWLASIGIAAFVLNYRVAPFRFPVPFLDAQRAVRYIRHHASLFNVDRDRIGMLGFSAGGHLTSMLGTLERRDWFPPGHVKDLVDAEPDDIFCMVLCYPVIDMDVNAHAGCRANILGRHPNQAIARSISTALHVSTMTPPTYIWTTKDDNVVPIVHSKTFSDALARNNVEHEYHVFEHGRHGLGLAEENPDVHQWTASCQSWLSRIGFSGSM